MSEYQYPHSKRQQIDKFFTAPATTGDPIGHEVTFLSYGIHIYTYTGLVFDKSIDGNGVATYAIITRDGAIYNCVKRHHIRGIADS